MKKKSSAIRNRTPSLIFPKLVFVRDSRIGKRRTRVKVFRLDWASVDERKKFPKLVRQMRRKVKARLHPLSGLLKSSMNTLFFALPHNYLGEIERYGKMAVEEWGHRRGFDTSVNDHCLSVAKACVDNFFYLLSDSLYAPERIKGKKQGKFTVFDLREYSFNTRADYWTQASWKCAMLFRFWNDQTGGWHVSRNSGLDGLRDLLKRMKPGKIYIPEEKGAVKFVLEELGKHPLSKISWA